MTLDTLSKLSVIEKGCEKTAFGFGKKLDAGREEVLRSRKSCDGEIIWGSGERSCDLV